MHASIGGFAPGSKLRALVVPRREIKETPPSPPPERSILDVLPRRPRGPRTQSKYRLDWAALLKRVFRVERALFSGLVCLGVSSGVDERSLGDGAFSRRVPDSHEGRLGVGPYLIEGPKRRSIFLRRPDGGVAVEIHPLTP